MKIVIGHRGDNHVTSTDFQSLLQGLAGSGNQVLNTGSLLYAEVIDSTHIRINDGDGLIQGVHFRIERDTSDVVEIESGTPGMYRTDLICARYTKDDTTGEEDVSLVVIKGTETSGSPVMPLYIDGEIMLGALTVDFPLHKVNIDGLSITTSKLHPPIKYVQYSEEFNISIPANGNYQQDVNDGVKFNPGMYLSGLTVSGTSSSSVQVILFGQYSGVLTSATGSSSSNNDNGLLNRNDIVSIAVSNQLTSAVNIMVYLEMTYVGS